MFVRQNLNRMDKKIAMNPNPVIQYLNKPAEQLTKEDLIRLLRITIYK